MRFNNAFLTKAGKVGMQFEDGKQTLTVYEDKHGNILFSEEANKKQQDILRAKYIHMKHRFYRPKQARSSDKTV